MIFLPYKHGAGTYVHLFTVLSFAVINTDTGICAWEVYIIPVNGSGSKPYVLATKISCRKVVACI